MLPFTGLPATAAWPWVIASVLIHIVYFAALIESYAAGDMGLVYPLARGSAPLMTATAAAVLLDEHLGLLGWLGIAVLAAGVLLLSLRGSRDLAKLDSPRHRLCAADRGDDLRLHAGRRRRRARRRQRAMPIPPRCSPASALSMAIYALVRRGAGVFALMAQHWKLGVGGGVMQVTSYGIAIWAMTVAPIALVGALRETSVLFGTILAVVFLKEPLLMPRVAAALMIVCGLVLIRLS